jgi:hypothetical protein
MDAQRSKQNRIPDEIHAESQRIRRQSAALLSTGTWLFIGVFLLAISGCSVQDNKNGQAENVKLRTPIGSLDVRTNAVHGPDVGLPVYPGAVETGKHGHDSGSADIHMSFGNWRLNVKAIEYRSNDPEDKIVAFYKNAMSQYGDVLTCKNRTAIAEPSKTSQGLTCANDHEYDVNMDASKKPATVQPSTITGDIKLLAGSPENQHIVEFNPTSDGTKFSMVLVQLPHKNQTD